MGRKQQIVKLHNGTPESQRSAFRFNVENGVHGRTYDPKHISINPKGVTVSKGIVKASDSASRIAQAMRKSTGSAYGDKMRSDWERSGARQSKPEIVQEKRQRVVNNKLKSNSDTRKKR